MSVDCLGSSISRMPELDVLGAKLNVLHNNFFVALVPARSRRALALAECHSQSFAWIFCLPASFPPDSRVLPVFAWYTDSYRSNQKTREERMLRTEQRPRGSQFPQRDLKSIPRQPSQRNLLGTPAPSRPVLPGDLRQIHVPHAIGGVPDAAMRRPFPSRRFFVTKTSLFVACSFLGLTTGFTAGVVRRVLASRALVSKPQGMPTFQPVLRFTAHQGIVRSVAWSPDGMQLASGADDTLLLLWKPDGVIVQQIHHVAPVQTVAWSPGGKRLVTGS